MATGPSSCRDLGLRFEIRDHADDILGHQPADRAAGIDRVQNLAVRGQQESCRLKIMRRLVGVGPGDGRHFVRVGAVPHREAQRELFNRTDGRGLVIDRQRHYLDAGLLQLFACALKPR